MKALTFSFLAAVLFFSAPRTRTAPASVSITSLPATISENFDTLPAAGIATWTNNSTIPGWYHARTGTGTTIVANDGSLNAGALYSYGTGTSTERALGSVGSGNATAGDFYWGIILTNNTTSTINSLEVTVTGEQWRNSAAAAQTVSFSYLVGTGLTGSLADFQATGVAVAALDFTSPVTGGAGGVLDGNQAANRTLLTFTITGLNIAPGQDVLLRWSDPDHAGADHGLSIDDFSVTATGVPVVCTPPPAGMVSWWPGDGSPEDIRDGNDGTLQGDTTYAAGKVGQAFDFDGVDDEVTFGNGPNLTTDAVTVDAWINPDSANGNFQTIISKWQQGPNSWGLFLVGNGPGTARIDGYVTTNVTGLNSSGGAIPVGTAAYTHVAMSYSATDGLRLYVNGVQVNTTVPGNGTIVASPATVNIGDDFDDSFQREFDGRIDEVELFNRALDGSDILAIYNAGSAGKCRPQCAPPPTEMISWWPGDNHPRDTQSGYDGTLRNGASYADGKVNEGFFFNGVDQDVSIGDPPNLRLSVPGITIDAWINPAALPPVGELSGILTKWTQNFSVSSAAMCTPFGSKTPVAPDSFWESSTAVMAASRASSPRPRAEPFRSIPLRTWP